MEKKYRLISVSDLPRARRYGNILFASDRETHLMWLWTDGTEYAGMAQSVERRIGSAEVTGPIPVSSLKNPWIFQGFFLLPWG